jgi:D-alanyl-lipoteichoic acid acyltransferase DltB (MBOAT superfamily)
VLFNSFEFALFYPLVALIFFALPPRFRWVHLLIASYVFYMAWQPVYGLLLAAGSAWDWWLARRMEDTAEEGPRRRLLWFSIGTNLLVLSIFKYFNLFNETLRAGFAGVGLVWPVPPSHLPLPIGLSFHTLQAMGYVIDVYRRQVKAERNMFRFGLFVAFFPQLVAGPIERATNLLHQLRRETMLEPERLVSGVRLMAWGLMKKVVIADNVAPVSAAVFGSPADFPGTAYILALLCFMLQVYCDFSGYSDIAVGAARILGYDLMKNFDQPYGSASIAEFWNRWHISLSSWFRDYLYIPLGGNRVSPARRYMNVLLMFALSGLWHGAEWHFLLWGLLHGCYLVLDLSTRGLRDALWKASGFGSYTRLRTAVGIAVTLVLVQLSYVLFCTKTLADAWYVYSHLLSGFGVPGLRAMGGFFTRIQVDGQLILGILCFYPLIELVEYGRRREDWCRWWSEAVPTPFRWSADWMLIVGTMLFGRFEAQIFMYFQF